MKENRSADKFTVGGRGELNLERKEKEKNFKRKMELIGGGTWLKFKIVILTYFAILTASERYKSEFTLYSCVYIYVLYIFTMK